MSWKKFISKIALLYGIVCFVLVVLVNIGSAAEQTWTIARQSELQADLLDIHFLDHDYGWIVGTKGAILHTSDSGEQWVSQSVKRSNDLNRVCFVDRKMGWTVGTKGLILHTLNSG